MRYSKWLKHPATCALLCAAASALPANAATSGANESEWREVLDLIAGVGCSNEYQELSTLVSKSKVLTRDTDYVTYKGSAFKEMMRQLPTNYAGEVVSVKELLFDFAIQPVYTLAKNYPSRNRPSLPNELAKALEYQRGSIEESRRFAESQSDTAKIIRASLKFKGCMVDSLAVPTLRRYRADFDNAISQKECRADFRGVLGGIREEYRELFTNYYAVQYGTNMGGVEVPGDFKRIPGSFAQLLDRGYVAFATASRLEEQRRGATLGSTVDGRELGQAKLKVARLSFAACMAVPAGAKNDPNAAVTLFIPAFNSPPGHCVLATCRVGSKAGETAFKCDPVARCKPRRAGYSAWRGHLGDPQGPEYHCPDATAMNPQQISSYLDPDMDWPIACTPEKP